MQKFKYLLYTTLIATLLTACGGDDFGLSVEEFIDQNNLVTDQLEEGVHIIIHEEGSGEKPFLDTPVTVKITGILTDSTVFKSSESTIFLLRNETRGLQLGLRELGVGGRATIIVPAEAGYGDVGRFPVPSGAVLVYEVEILALNESLATTIEEYIAQNNLTTTALAQGVHIVIKEPGGNSKPNLGSTVTVNYVGTLLNGTQFDAGNNVEFPLANLILGWQIGIPELGEGGSCTLIIPPSAGYGSSGSGSIPPNAILIFELDLIDFS